MVTEFQISPNCNSSDQSSLDPLLRTSESSYLTSEHSTSSISAETGKQALCSEADYDSMLREFQIAPSPSNSTNPSSKYLSPGRLPLAFVQSTETGEEVSDPEDSSPIVVPKKRSHKKVAKPSYTSLSLPPLAFA